MELFPARDTINYNICRKSVNVISRKYCCTMLQYGSMFSFLVATTNRRPLDISKLWSETTSGCTIHTSHDSSCCPTQKVVEESRKIGCENPWKSSLGWNLYSIPPGLTGFLFLLRLHWALNFPQGQKSPAVQEDLSADEISHLLLVTQCPGF